jgi:paraquat-inducible protein B
LPESTPGLHIKFKTDRLGALSVGAPIFLRQVRIGSVQTTAMATDGSGVEVGAFILPQYADMVHKSTRFWNASGVQVDIGLGGVHIETESLISLLAGGSSMSLPDDKDTSAKASNGDSFFLYQDYEAAETSTFVNVRFPTAEGLTKGITKVMYKGIPIGKLRDIWYRDEDDAVIGRFGIDPRFESFITNKARFWLVRPQLSAAGITGLDALVSGGAYLAFAPSVDGIPAKNHEFIAASGPDVMDFSAPGLHLRLTAPVASAASRGAPVYYKKFVVGSVQNQALEKDQAVLHILIKPEYRYLVNKSSRFWNVSGVKVSASLRDGVKIQSESATALLAGGIAFDTPNSKAQKNIHDGETYPLFDDEKQATAIVPGSLPGTYLTLEADNAGGIAVDAPVLFHGLPVGSVQALQHSDDGKQIQIRIYIAPEHKKNVKTSSRFWRASAVDMKVDTSGMRLQVGSVAQMLDGGIAFDNFQEANAKTIAASFSVNEVKADDCFRLFSSREEASNAGVTVRLHLADAKGLHTGSDIRYRGIALGEITRLQLRSDLQGVDADAALKLEAVPLLTTGSRFWKVEPAVGLARVQNLDALLGSYLELRPGKGAAAREFSVAKQEPVVTALPDGLNVRVTAEQAGSLKSGAPVLYRQVPVGTVLGTEVSESGDSVYIYLNILPQYAKLVHVDSRFWSVSGIDVNAGLFSGINVHTESAESVLSGGLAFSTPKQSTELAKEGAYFVLGEKP